MWYGREVIPSFDCDIEIKLRDGRIVDGSMKDKEVQPKYGDEVVKWRFVGDIQYFRGDKTTQYLPSEDKKPVDTERVQYYTIKHLEKENAYLRQEVEILKERITEYEIQGKKDA